MNAKKDMLDRINKQVAKTKALRASRYSKENIEEWAFDFFRQAEENQSLGELEKSFLVSMAFDIFYSKMRGIDKQCLCDIVWVEGTGSVQGVKIKWSSLHQTTYSTEPEFYIDVSQMLFG